MAGDRIETETDVDPDDAEARTRAVGGRDNPDTPDRNSTTGTTPNEVHVGRASGPDAGYAGETGAERRAAES